MTAEGAPPAGTSRWIAGDRLPVIETARLRLRALEAGDLEAILAIFSHPDVLRYWGGDPVFDADGAARHLERVREGFIRQELLQWGLARRDDDVVIGTCTLTRLDRRNRRSEIGFALARDHWGRGYMTEALPALLRYAFVELDLHRLEADVDPRNARSVALVERLGFRYEGVLRERWLVAGEAQDSAMYGLLRREWSPRS